MTIFIPVDYHGKRYPEGIVCNIKEIAGHLDTKGICVNMPYSLHTEYSAAPRQLNSALLAPYPELKQQTSENGVPLLWHSKQWADEFAGFVLDLIRTNPSGIAPTDIEIHPPFRKYCPSAEAFLERFAVFEERIHASLPDTQILLENRSGHKAGSQYRFLISTIADTAAFLEKLSHSGCPLKVVADYPQFFTAAGWNQKSVFPTETFAHEHERLRPYRHLIGGIHIWGRAGCAHVGGLDSLFRNNLAIKRQFLELIREFYNDDVPRFFVPEVNSGEKDLQSIVNDFRDAGIRFRSL